MATRSEAKLAIWSASKKDDAARAALSAWIQANSQDGPGGSVDDAALQAEVDRITAAAKAESKKRGKK